MFFFLSKTLDPQAESTACRPTRLHEAATTPDAIAKLLAKHGLGPRPPPSRAAPTGQLRLAFSTA